MNLPPNLTILVLAPHTDDAELGCGGTISRLVQEGHSVHVAAFSTCAESLPASLPPDTLEREFMAAMPVLGVPSQNLRVFSFPVRRLSEHRQEVLEILVRLRSELRPSTVFVPSAHDLHQDHQVLHAEGLRAFKQVTLLGYELPWNNITFDATAFFTLGAAHLAAKSAALAHYKSQAHLGRPYFDPEFLQAWARFRGLQVGADFAEVFEVLRIRW